MPKGEARKAIYLSLFMRSLTLSLIGVFVPAFLLTLNFSLTQVFLYELVVYATFTVCAPIAAQIASKLGLKKAIILAPITTGIHIVSLYGLEFYPAILFPSAIICGFAAAIYWIPVNVYFAENTEHSHVAEESGYLHAVAYFAGVVGPLAGGLIISKLGFNFLYGIGGSILALSMLPLFFVKDYTFKLKREWTKSFTKENIHYIKTFFFQGVFAMCAGIVFPLFVYLKTSSFETTGFVVACQGVGTAIAAIFAGRIADKFGKHWMQRTTAFLNSIVWLIAIFVQSTIALYVLAVFIGLFEVFFDIAIFGIFCDVIRGGKATEKMVFREIGVNLGRTAIFIPMLIFIPYAFLIAFMLSAASALYLMFVSVDGKKGRK